MKEESPWKILPGLLFVILLLAGYNIVETELAHRYYMRYIRNNITEHTPEYIKTQSDKYSTSEKLRKAAGTDTVLARLLHTIPLTYTLVHVGSIYTATDTLYSITYKPLSLYTEYYCTHTYSKAGLLYRTDLYLE